MAVANNPFDINAQQPATVNPTTPAVGLLQNAVNTTAAPTTTGYNAATTNATGYNAATANSTGYTPDQANLNNWNVDSNQTVQGQLSGILAANSPLLQQARATSLAQMNQRGLTNSSMAVGAGQEAVIKSALPIAQQDATTYGQSGQFNANAANQTSQFNTQSANQAAQFGAGAANTANLANTQETNRANEYTAGATNTANLSNTAAANQAAQFTATAANQNSQQYSQQLNANVTKQLDQSLQASMANADSATKLQLQQIDATTRQGLAQIEADYKNQMQVSASSSDIFNQTSKNIADIMSNPDLYAYPTTDGAVPTADNLPPGATLTATGHVMGADGLEIFSPKQTAINIQRDSLRNAMAILSQTTGIKGLKELIDFSA